MYKSPQKSKDKLKNTWKMSKKTRRSSTKLQCSKGLFTIVFHTSGYVSFKPWISKLKTFSNLKKNYTNGGVDITRYR